MTFKDWPPPPIESMRDYGDVIETIVILGLIIDRSMKPNIEKMLPVGFSMSLIDHRDDLKMLANSYGETFE